MLQISMIVIIIFSSLIAVSYAQQEREVVKVGDLVKLESIRGKVTNREIESKEMLNASILLTGEITDINKTRILIEIIDGHLQIGEQQ